VTSWRFGSALFLLVSLVALIYAFLADDQVSWISLSVSFSSLALGFTSIRMGSEASHLGNEALGLAQASDQMMKSVASLEFAEKGAAIRSYTEAFNENLTNAQLLFPRFRWDVEAVSHVSKWAAESDRSRLANELDQAIDRLQALLAYIQTDHGYQRSDLANLRTLSSRIRQGIPPDFEETAASKDRD